MTPAGQGSVSCCCIGSQVASGHCERPAKRHARRPWLRRPVQARLMRSPAPSAPAAARAPPRPRPACPPRATPAAEGEEAASAWPGERVGGEAAARAGGTTALQAPEPMPAAPHPRPAPDTAALPCRRCGSARLCMRVRAPGRAHLDERHELAHVADFLCARHELLLAHGCEPGRGRQGGQVRAGRRMVHQLGPG